MITVWRGKYVYRYDGITGVIQNSELTNKNSRAYTVVLNQWDILKANKSNSYIDMMIEVNRNILG